MHLFTGTAEPIVDSTAAFVFLLVCHPKGWRLCLYLEPDISFCKEMQRVLMYSQWLQYTKSLCCPSGCYFWTLYFYQRGFSDLTPVETHLLLLLNLPKPQAIAWDAHLRHKNPKQNCKYCKTIRSKWTTLSSVDETYRSLFFKVIIRPECVKNITNIDNLISNESEM